MYVELIGLPGAGKTTVARSVSLPPIDHVLAWRRHRFSRADWRQVAPALWNVLRCARTMVMLITWGAGGRVIARALLRRCWERRHGISDHGFVQTLAQHREVSGRLCRDPLLLDKILRRLPTDVCVFLEVPMEIAQRRARDRATYSLEDRVFEEHCAFYEAMLGVGFPLYRVAATPPLPDVISAVDQVLQSARHTPRKTGS
ncbi:MAG: hypothetical protein AAF628_32140 [Planctomycetota bacterium]